MKTLFDPAAVERIKQRMAQLSPESVPLWGKMSAAQALAHCAEAFKMTWGEVRPPRILMGRIFGSFAKKSMIVNEKPMPRNVGTAPNLIVSDARELTVERQGLSDAIDRFVAGGPAACTGHPHFFFGPLTPQEWSGLMYQHLDHHLRQFGV